MLRAELYNYSGEVNKIQKSLGNAIYSVPFTFLDNYDLQTPHIVLTLAGEDANGTTMQAYMAFQVNYIVIYDSDNAAFRKQYYFVDKVIWQTNELLEFALRKDVLMTYVTSIVNLEGLLERCEDSTLWTPEIVDEFLPFAKEYKVTQTVKTSFSANADTPEEVWLVLNVIQDTFSPNESGSFSQGDFEDDGKVGTDWLVEIGGSINSTIYAIHFNNPSDASKYVNSLSQSFISENALVTSFVLGVWICPVPLESTFMTRLKDIEPDIPDGGFYIGTSGRTLSPGSEGTVYYISTISGYLSHVFSFYKELIFAVPPRIYNDFRDFNPYTKMSICVPYFGEYEVDPSVLYNNNLPTSTANMIALRYVLNFMDGTSYCIVMLRDATSRKAIVLDVLPVDVLVPVPLNSSTIDNVRRQADANSFKAIAGAISGLSGIVIATAGNPAVGFGLSAALGTGAVANSLLSSAANQATNVPNGIKNYSSTNSFVSQFCRNLKGALLKVYSSVSLDDVYSNSEFNHLFGRPSIKIASISSISADSYIRYKSIHADIPYATSQEKEEIERLLMSGVYK